MTDARPYVPPPGISLLFASRTEIEAAPSAERQAYYAIVEGIMADPGACGFRFETAEDLQREDSDDRRLSAANQDWGTS